VMRTKSTTRNLDPETAQSDPMDSTSNSAGQAGDTQGLSTNEEADSQSVEELLEEGQSFEASVIGGIEDAPTPDVSEVRTREIPEDDVPLEYLEDEHKI